MGEPGKAFALLQNALWIFSVFLLPQSFGEAREGEEVENAIELAASSFKSHPLNSDEGFTVNFNNVPIIEYIRFISKTTGLNFAFDEADLQFNITLVSEEPISSESLMSALMQILRVHDLTLLEQENNILITPSKAVSQIPALVVEDLSKAKYAPLVTRVFRIKNGNVNSLASILKPLMSASALVEISPETRQLIVTDITTNVDKIASLIETLDTPHSQLEIDSYVAKNIPPADLVRLATQIMAPFAEGSPFLFAPQPETDTIFIVSTPYLIERTLTVLEDLDVIPSTKALELGHKAQSDFFIYTPQTRSGKEISQRLDEIAKNLKDSGLSDRQFLEAIHSKRWIESTNSLIFTGDPKALLRIQEIVKAFDTPGGFVSQEKNQVFLYKLDCAQGPLIIQSLKNMEPNLTSTEEDQSLIQAIHDIKWVKDTNSLLITAPPSAIEKLKTYIAKFDLPQLCLQAAPEYFIYKPQKLSAKQLEQALKELAQDMEAAGLSDVNLLQTINTARYVESTQTLLFTGTPESLQKLKDLLSRVDHIPGEAPAIQQVSTTTFFVYKLQFVPATQFMNSLRAFAADLPTTDPADKELVKAIQSMKWVKETNSVLFTGSEAVLKKIEDLTKKFDNEALAGIRAPQDYVLYSPKNQKGEDLIAILCDFEKSLQQSGVQDQELFNTINNLKWIEKTSSLLITGNSASITKVQSLLERFDVPSKEAKVANIESIDNTSFLVYKLQYHQGNDIQEALKQIGQDILAANPGSNQSLLSAINTVQWIKITNSLLVSGPQETLTKLRELMQNLDMPLRQVFIEILIVETSLTNSQSFGLQWGGKTQYFNRMLAGVINQPAANQAAQNTTANTDLGGAFNEINPIAGSTTNPVLPPSVLSGTPTPVSFIPWSEQGFNLGVIGDLIMHKGQSFLTLGTLVKALESDNDSTIVMNPKIIAQDNNTSTIFVGQNIPFAGSSVNQTGQNTTTITANIEYRDVGVNLSLTPVLGNNDVVTLDIVLDLTAQTANTTPAATTGDSTAQGVQTTHTSMNTRVHVPSDHFLALSGMISDTKARFKSGLPCLGGLPVVGFLFSENDRTNSKDNIIFFVRPHIIDSTEDYKKFTQYQESVYKEQAVLPILKEEFDSGVNIVKTPEDE